MANKNLTAAKKAKNDEFYTQLKDVENELRHYKQHFKGKVVLCNCDDHKISNFFKYFQLNFEHLGLEKLISTHYDKGNVSTAVVMTSEGVEEINMEGDGDFRSDECVAFLEQADIVVTNPPFSLFREFVSLLEERGKKYLIIGSQNAITYKETFKLIKANKIWLGINLCKEFVQPDGTIKKFGNIGWFTNLTHHKRNETLALGASIKDMDYPQYDNYDAIEVSKTCNIPFDYDGVMGVPITFLTKYNPEQFEILSANDHTREGCERSDSASEIDSPILKGKRLYKRILIKRKVG
jgi:hypothetical protein